MENVKFRKVPDLTSVSEKLIFDELVESIGEEGAFHSGNFLAKDEMGESEEMMNEFAEHNLAEGVMDGKTCEFSRHATSK